MESGQAVRGRHLAGTLKEVPQALFISAPVCSVHGTSHSLQSPTGFVCLPIRAQAPEWGLG